MHDIKLYGSRVGTGFRCHWMLAELGLEYATVAVDLSKGEHRTPEYLAINPAGQVPALVIDGFHLAESVAINWYLATRFGAELLGSTPETQATALRWTLWTILNPERQFSTLVQPRWTGVHNETAETAAQEKLPGMLALLDAHLADKPYLAGDAFTVADINARSSFQYAEMLSYDLSAYSNVHAWIQRVSERPAYVAAKG